MVCIKIKDKLKLLLKNKIPLEFIEQIPSGYNVTGDIAIIRFQSSLSERYKHIIGKEIIKLDPRVNVVVEQTNTLSSIRKPVIRFIAGEFRTTTIHKELGTEFFIDVARITFSPGNKAERERLLQIITDGEIIVDMFACIGNLSLPLTVHHPNVKVYGIEKNPAAYYFLKKNVSKNNLSERYFPIFGDNRLTTPKNIATRVIMGYFEIDNIQLKVALNALKNKGWIHYHTLIEKEKISDSVELVLKKFQEVDTHNNYKIDIPNMRVVKKFSPTKVHACYDVYIVGKI